MRMKQPKKLEQYWDELKTDPVFIAESLVVDIVENVIEIMESQRISNSELARRLGTSKAYISKILNGNPNMTILTLSKIASALNVKVSAPELTPYSIINPNYIKDRSKGLVEDDSHVDQLANAA
jgi:transcriptional regulator with XRE-family HTH domain